MSVTVPSSQSAGPDGHYTAPVVTKVEAPKIAAPEEGGAQPDSREQQSHYQPKDQLSQHLAVLAKRAEQMSQRQMALAQKAAQDAVQQVPLRATSLSSETSSRPSSPASGAPVSPEPLADPWTLVMEKQQAYHDSQPGPAEVYGLPEALARYDSNGDGRIDQTEMRNVVRAKDKDSSYAGLAQPSHPTEAELEAALQLEQPKKLYADDAKIQEELAVQPLPEALLPGEKRLLEQMSGEPRRMFAQEEDPSAKVVSGTYQSVADGPSGRRSIVT